MQRGGRGHVQSVSLREIEYECDISLECVPKFCYLGDMLSAEGDVEEVGRARVRCASLSYLPSWQPVMHHII